ncbi:glycosyltransferase family 87 protein [Sphingomonas sp. LY160]|uniref:glycosyltransferase family 87 protein n=1 Tax=Sphingomonas sp. LY160 TaxID=3095342 RepID=UPI002ADEFC1E|nr:glycosyltransferase family 87 protein [Sphingomonas sp. LY160]MEA1071302.1 glycosyltransferase family 87 protein [Sphingomonas sp. LY160]
MGDRSKILGRFQVGAALAAAVLATLAWFLYTPTNPLGQDFSAFRGAASQSADLIYSKSWPPFAYPPPAIPLFEPLAYLPHWVAFSMWTAGSVAAFFVAVRKIYGGRIAALAMFSAPALQGLIAGQSSMLLGSAILYAFALPPFGGGVLLGIVAAIKPQLLVMAPLAILVRRDWEMMNGAILGFAIAVAVSLLLFGPAIWLDWIDSLEKFKETVIGYNIVHNAITPASVAIRLGFDPLPWMLAGAVLGAGTVIAASRRLESGELAALIIGCGFLAVPYAMTYDTVALIPACAAYILSRPGFKAFPAMSIIGAGLVPLMLVVMASWSGFLHNFRLASRRHGRGDGERPVGDPVVAIPVEQASRFE